MADYWFGMLPTFATSHLSIAASEVCAAANQAEQTKIKKYSYRTSHAYHSFTPVAFETSGVCGPRSMSFLMDLGHHIANTTGDKSSLAYLLQKFSVAIQRGMLHPFWELCLQPSPLLSMMSFSGSMIFKCIELSFCMKIKKMHAI